MANPSSSPRLKLVPDTGFYIAAALQNGYARSYLVGRGSKFLTYSLYTSEAILLEVQNVLETRFQFDRPKVVTALLQIRRVTTVVYPTYTLDVVRDPDDNKILECALEAGANLVVAFDKDLLDMKEFQDIKIIHPSQLQYLFPATPAE
jgi:putative PIN family toxin of toxin-antitoxin system